MTFSHVESVLLPHDEPSGTSGGGEHDGSADVEHRASTFGGSNLAGAASGARADLATAKVSSSALAGGAAALLGALALAALAIFAALAVLATLAVLTAHAGNRGSINGLIHFVLFV